MKGFIKAVLAVVMFCFMIGLFGWELSLIIPNTPKENVISSR